MTTRRQALLLGTAALAAAAARVSFPQVARARRSLDLLILGGTGFLGPHQVQYALARGHRVTLFNRGHKDASQYGDRVEVLIGDRDPHTATGLAVLEGTRAFDAVIDNSGYLPRHVRASAQLLRGRVRRYLFVSTAAAYEGSEPVCTEAAALRALADAENEQLTPRSYGALKAEGDRIVREVYGAAATVVRPTFVVGPGDETDRFTYWAARVAAGGTVVGPRADAKQLQVVDVRDLCPWMVRLLEDEVAGVFNAATPNASWDLVLAALRPLSAVPVQFVRPPAQVIERLQLDFPLVEPVVNGGGIFANPHTSFDGSKATHAGLTYRTLADSGSATLAWWQAQTPERRAQAKHWPSREQEQSVLEQLRKD